MFYISLTARARDETLTLKYSVCCPLGKPVFIIWIRRPSPEKIEKRKVILSVFSSTTTATARDAVFTLKCAGHCPLAIGIFSFWIRRLNPEKIEKEKNHEHFTKRRVYTVLYAPLNIASMIVQRIQGMVQPLVTLSKNTLIYLAEYVQTCKLLTEKKTLDGTRTHNLGITNPTPKQMSHCAPRCLTNSRTDY